MTSAMASAAVEVFPKTGILPKRETNASSFLERYPSYDGRGVIVAILDTGCDPSAEGLQVTSDGKPKFVDVVDCTGSGDVDTSTIVKPDSDQIITGLSGRKLLVPSSADPVNGEYHIGLLNAYNVFPKFSKNRCEKMRSEKWAEKHGKLIASIHKQIESLENPSSKTGNNDDSEGNANQLADLKERLGLFSKLSNSQTGPICDLIVWNDKQDGWVAILDTSSVEPYFKCEELDEISSETGGDSSSVSAAAAASSEDDEKKEASQVIKKGVIDLSRGKIMTNYRKKNQFDFFSAIDLLSYVLNIYDNGNLVSVVTPGGNHGSHVAGIVSAFYEKDSGKNGIAPGAQCVSIKIGDTRLGTMETGQGLMRAMSTILENKVDICNMSYGEPSTNPKAGAFPEAINDLVWKHGITFLSSAGNDGPCLTTAGAPQSSCEAMIGIGAYFSPDMIKMEYGYLDKPNAAMYSWSSRGPTTDGAMGVKLIAPGGAIAPVTKYSLQHNQLMNGTSMACPSAVGNVSLLMSALKQNEITYTPIGIENTLVETCQFIPTIEGAAQGFGLIQIDRAFEYAQKHGLKSSPSLPSLLNVHTRYEISITATNPNAQTWLGSNRGIYIRDTSMAIDDKLRFRVGITPKFHESVSAMIQSEFELQCTLISDSEFVETAPHLIIASRGRSFQVIVDLAKAKASYLARARAGQSSLSYIRAFVNGYDARRGRETSQSGPVFRIPILVCIPWHWIQSSSRSLAIKETPLLSIPGDSTSKFNFIDDFSVGVINRRFINVPIGASHAIIRVKCLETANDKKNSFVFASLWKNGRAFKAFDRYFLVRKDSEQIFTLLVRPCTLLEVTLAQRSLSTGETRLAWSIEFKGPIINDNETPVSLLNGDTFTRIVLKTRGIESAKNKMACHFKTFSRFIQPSDWEGPKALSVERGDVTVNGDQVYAVKIQWKFDVTLAGSTIPRFNLLNDLLYDAPFDGILWQIFDSDKNLIGSGEAFKEKVTLAKKTGYLAIMEIRSSSIGFFDRLKGMNMQLRLDTVMSKPLSATFYSSQRALLAKRALTGQFSLKKHDNRVVLLSANWSAKDIKNSIGGNGYKIQPGDHLRGWITTDERVFKSSSDFSILQAGFRNNGDRGEAAFGYPITVALSPAANLTALATANEKKKVPVIKKKPSDKKKSDKKPSLDERQRDAMINLISNVLKSDPNEQNSAMTSFGNDLIKKFPDHLPLFKMDLDVALNAAFNGKKNGDDADDKKDSDKSDKYLNVISKADNLLNKIDGLKVSAWFGRKMVDDKSDEFKATAKKMKEDKELIIDSLQAKLKTSLVLAQNGSDGFDFKLLENALNELKSWTDVDKLTKNDGIKLIFNVNLFLFESKKMYGHMIKVIGAYAGRDEIKKDSGKAREILDMKIRYFGKYFGQEFPHVYSQMKLERIAKFPRSYRIH